jgi:hypothetical protein
MTTQNSHREISDIADTQPIAKFYDSLTLDNCLAPTDRKKLTLARCSFSIKPEYTYKFKRLMG